MKPIPPSLFRRSLQAALCILVLSLFAGSSPAQGQQVRQITFDEAVRIALEQNIALKRAANNTELQALDVFEDRMNFFPDLGFSTRGQQSYGRNFSQEELGFVNETTESMNFGLSSDINVFRGFADVATYRQSRLAAEAGEEQLGRARQTVVFEVMSDYLTLIEREEQIRVREENLEAQRQLLAQIEEFVRVGARPISDQYQQAADVANAELNLLEAQRLYQFSESSLIQTLQLDPFQAYAFVAPEVGEAELTAEAYDLQVLLRNAFDRRVDLRAGELQIEAAGEGVRVARSGYWPSVGFSVGYGSGWYSEYISSTDLAQYQEEVQNNPNAAFPPTAPFFTQLDERRSGSVGLNLTLPIFDRFTTRNNVQRARVRYENTRLALEELRHDVAVQVRQAYLDYLTAEKRLDVTETQLAAAELAQEAAQERYNVGAATLVELSQAQAALVQAASARVQARYDFLFQEKLIDYYLGVLDPQEPLF